RRPHGAGRGDRVGSVSRNPGDDVLVRWPSMSPFAVIGTGCIIAGGLVAAVTGPLGFEDGAWVAAYLVLVAGVAQVGLGAGRVLLVNQPPNARIRNLLLACWNLGNVAVLAGTLAELTALVVAGGAALFVALVLFLTGT